MWNRQTHIKSLSTVQSCLCRKWSCARTWEIWTDLPSRCNCQKISDLHPFEPVPVFGYSCPSIWLLCHLCTHRRHQIHRLYRGMFLLHLHCDWLQGNAKSGHLVRYNIWVEIAQAWQVLCGLHQKADILDIHLTPDSRYGQLPKLGKKYCLALIWI